MMGVAMTYADIAKTKDQLGGKIYGIEPGSGANGTISKMISDNTFGLSGFKLIESSEQAMLAETSHRIKEGKPVVFFGSGACRDPDERQPADGLPGRMATTCSGPNDGGFTVATSNLNAGYAKECPNVERLLPQT